MHGDVFRSGPAAIAALLVGIQALGAVGATGWRNDGSGKYPAVSPEPFGTPAENLIWKTELAKWSNASPIVADGRVFLCEEPSTLVCLSAADGSELWRQSLPWESFIEPDRLKEIRKVEAERDALSKQDRALNKQEKELKKKGEAAKEELATVREERRALKQKLKALPREAGRPRTHGTNGYSSPTPVHDGSRVYVLFGTGVAGCFDMDGAKQWAVLLGRPGHNWGHSASPVMSGGHLIVHMGSEVYGLDPVSGETAWTAKSNSHWGTPAAFAIGDEPVVFTSGGELIRARDGAVLAKDVFDAPWTSPQVHDGVLYIVDERGAAAFRVPGEVTDEMQLEELWRMKPKKDRYYASALVHDGLVYAVTRNRHMTVLDAADGSVVYEQGLGLGGTAYPSPCLVGNEILVGADTGKMQFIAPGREYTVLRECALDGFRSTPYFSGGRMFVRTQKAMYCIGE